MRSKARQVFELGIRMHPLSVKDGSLWRVLEARPESRPDQSVEDALLSILKVFWGKRINCSR